MNRQPRWPSGRRAAVLMAALLPCLVQAEVRDADLLSAIRDGDYAGVRLLLAAHAASANRVLPDGATPLSWAVETQDPQMVRLLLEAKAKPNAAPDAAASPLMLACEHGEAAILNLLLDAGADARRSRADGIAALEVCAGNAPAAVVQRLLAGGAEVNRADNEGQTALMWAAVHGRVDNIHLLLEHGADVNRETANGFTPLFFALKSGNPAAPAAILDAGGAPDHVSADGTTTVQLAMYQKDYAFAARMIARKADLTALDRNGNTLLQAAVIAQRPELVKLLLAKAADPNAMTGASRVTWRYEANFTSAKYEQVSTSPLLLAAGTGNTDIMQLLVSAGADPKIRATDGTTLIHAAVAGGHVAALAEALRLLPDPNATDHNGRTPLHLIFSDDPGPETDALLQLLARSGAKTDIRDHKGRSAADLARLASASLQTSYAVAFDKRKASS
jgi:ankyrin repeat protein